jgi:hypothetical protein
MLAFPENVGKKISIDILKTFSIEAPKLFSVLFVFYLAHGAL